MTDINSDRAGRLAPLPVRSARAGEEGDRDQDPLVALIELLFFAYRDFTAEPDTVLAEFGFGRAHHRVLHFVHRRPGLRVADLLDILKITKQSLARVLKQLVDRGFIVQRAGASDRRERRLYLTPAGTQLADKLVRLQIARIEGALAEAGPDAAPVARAFLLGMIDGQDRGAVEAVIAGLRALPAASALGKADR
jgi:DNA-binding MarR family transcriptional regulator